MVPATGALVTTSVFFSGGQAFGLLGNCQPRQENHDDQVRRCHPALLRQSGVLPRRRSSPRMPLQVDVLCSRTDMLCPCSELLCPCSELLCAGSGDHRSSRRLRASRGEHEPRRSVGRDFPKLLVRPVAARGRHCRCPDDCTPQETRIKHVPCRSQNAGHSPVIRIGGNQNAESIWRELQVHSRLFFRAASRESTLPSALEVR